MLTYNKFARLEAIIKLNGWQLKIGILSWLRNFLAIMFTHVALRNDDGTHLLSWWDHRKSHLINKEVFRDVLKNLLVKATKHVLQDGLDLDLDSICNSYTAVYFLGIFSERSYLVIVHEIPIFDQCLIVLA